MGSNKIKNTSAEIIIDSSDLSVVGFLEVIKIYPKLLRSLNIMKKSIDSIKPDLIILIDYQEFNMKLAKYAKSRGVKVLFYISPQIWAWRESRVKNIINNIDIMAVIFPFEKKYYDQLGLETHYVGHPLVESKNYKEDNYKKDNYIGFFPGSRINEVRKHLPIMKKIISKISKNKEILIWFILIFIGAMILKSHSLKAFSRIGLLIIIYLSFCMLLFQSNGQWTSPIAPLALFIVMTIFSLVLSEKKTS